MKIYLALVYHPDDQTEILYCGTDESIAHSKLDAYPSSGDRGHLRDIPSLEIWEDGVCIEGDRKLEGDTE